MISDKKFKRLCEIDEKMLNGKKITEAEFKERTEIIKFYLIGKTAKGLKLKKHMQNVREKILCIKSFQ